MRVLVACEYSGIVREAFAARGHRAVSCDLLPTEQAPGPNASHYQGDVRDILDWGWDLMVGHPDCTFLTNSGIRWLYEEWTGEEKAAHLAATGQKLRGHSRRRNEARWAAMADAVDFYRLLWESPIERIALENPRMHPYAQEAIGGGPTQVIQPWQFGTPETKATGLRLKNLPPLVERADATEVLAYGRTLPDKVFARVHNLPPSPTRWKERSRTFPGVGVAMAEQWGDL